MGGHGVEDAVVQIGRVDMNADGLPKHHVVVRALAAEVLDLGDAERLALEGGRRRRETGEANMSRNWLDHFERTVG